MLQSLLQRMFSTAQRLIVGQPLTVYEAAQIAVGSVAYYPGGANGPNYGFFQLDGINPPTVYTMRMLDTTGQWTNLYVDNTSSIVYGGW